MKGARAGYGPQAGERSLRWNGAVLAIPLSAYAVTAAGLRSTISVGEIRSQIWVKMRFQLSQ